MVLEKRATEQRSIDEALSLLDRKVHHARAVIDRLRRIATIPSGARVLDVGSAQGYFLIACDRMGFDAVGVEPYEPAIEVSRRLATEVGARIDVTHGNAEALPFDPNTFDIVHANSVIEHVDDAGAAFSEAYRVLKPGGVFWFLTASSLSPMQSEIRGFPGFGWYPDALKRKIMYWAKEHKPELIGHTGAPAIHWFTPAKARAMLATAGFKSVYDRWDLRGTDEGGRTYRVLLSVIRSSTITKFIADVALPACSYAAVK
ncbi:MAG TPA: methyltransferase domain-containing protein [Candidatus Binatus sp.]|nr:methyltransferase domain-containing protein [Candidatus Binatus sp.]